MSKQKKWLTKGGLQRDDSDDELGLEDIPWQWIYTSPDEPGKEIDEQTPTKKRKASALAETPKQGVIVGARMSTFTVKVGDAVLLKSPEEGKDWVGLICAFSDTDDDGEDEMCAHIQWFCSPEELMGGKKSKMRSDVLPNESYITADFNMNPLTSINGKAEVLSKDAFFQKYPGGKAPRSKVAYVRYSKTVLCRRGVKQRNLQYTDEFDWDQMYQGPESILSLVDWIKDQTKSRRKQAAGPDSKEDSEYLHKPEPECVSQPTTPRKRRKTTSVTTTPRSSVKSSKSAAYCTPTHKRIKIKAPLTITPLSTRLLPTSHYSSPYTHARSTLHVSSVPLTLPCRSTEFATVYSHLASAIADGAGACIYISGTPGTGKTATVRECVSALHSAVLADELDDFNFVEINGMKVTEPAQSYALLWEAIKGDRVSPTHALSLLEGEFSHPSPRRIPTVVLMDELDQLVTKSQSVMYNFFNWPALRHSRLIVLAVANTMDLPERTLSNKISSRLGLTRITFPGYTHQQLMEIIQSRLEGVEGGIVDADAVQFASRKVAAVSGDARRALDICRRAVEIAEEQSQKEQEDEVVGAETPSKRHRKTRGKWEELDAVAAENGRESGMKRGRVTIATIKAAINEATSSPVVQHLRSLPLASKIFLAALLARGRRTGVSDATLGEVLTEAKRLADLSENPSIREWLLYSNMESRGKEPLPQVLGMGAAATELVEAGIVSVESRAKGQRHGKMRLRVGDDEVKSALADDEEVRGLGINA